ncbi:MAG: hypothetical protein IJS88_04240 [Alphaproteobacteria bacterium]|nr:hypothetical protein [Alphaproteobacteria bacterium]
MNRKTLLALLLLSIVIPTGPARSEDSILGVSEPISSGDNTSLSDFIDSGETKSPPPATQTKSEQPKEENTKSWIGEMWEKGSKKIMSSEKKETVPIKRSNASVFDIAGVMLRMNGQQVDEALKKRGYRRISASMEIPNFIRWRYEEMCRNKNVVGYERLNNCVVRLSKQNNYQYIERLLYNNFSTKESVSVNFTSNFTGNKAYFIEYRSEAANIKGSGPKAEYLRNLKIFDFWKKITQKYGFPDNQQQVTWGLGINKPVLHAEDGHLTLHDPMLLELDRSRMAREDQKFMHTAIYTF